MKRGSTGALLLLLLMVLGLVYLYPRFVTYLQSGTDLSKIREAFQNYGPEQDVERVISNPKTLVPETFCNLYEDNLEKETSKEICNILNVSWENGVKASKTFRFWTESARAKRFDNGTTVYFAVYSLQFKAIEENFTQTEREFIAENILDFVDEWLKLHVYSVKPVVFIREDQKVVEFLSGIYRDFEGRLTICHHRIEKRGERIENRVTCFGPKELFKLREIEEQPKIYLFLGPYPAKDIRLLQLVDLVVGNGVSDATLKTAIADGLLGSVTATYAAGSGREWQCNDDVGCISIVRELTNPLCTSSLRSAYESFSQELSEIYELEYPPSCKIVEIYYMPKASWEAVFNLEEYVDPTKIAGISESEEKIVYHFNFTVTNYREMLKRLNEIAVVKGIESGTLVFPLTGEEREFSAEFGKENITVEIVKGLKD